MTISFYFFKLWHTKQCGTALRISTACYHTYTKRYESTCVYFIQSKEEKEINFVLQKEHVNSIGKKKEIKNIYILIYKKNSENFSKKFPIFFFKIMNLRGIHEIEA